MAMSGNINPEVLADMISAQLPKAIKFAPFAKLDNTLVGQPGTTVTIPKFDYIGDAATVAEYAAMGVAELATQKVDYTIKKAGKAVKLSDEEILSGFGDPVGEAAKQVSMAMANFVDNEFLAEYNKTLLVHDKAAVAMDHAMLADALKLFGDNEDQKVLFVHPEKYADLLKNDKFIDASQYGQNVLFSGEIGQILGMRVVKASKLAKAGLVYDSFIAAPNAVTIFSKRAPQVEVDRDILTATNFVAVNGHYVVALTDATKVVKVKSL